MTGLTPLINQGNGCDYHRIVTPLTTMGVDLNYFADKKIIDVIKDTKILFFNRIPPTGALELFKELRRQLGFKVVVDLDDYWILHPKHILYAFWNYNKIGEQIVESIKFADVVTVTTSRLASKVMEYNKNVHVIPNAIPFGQGQFNDDRNTSLYTRFIYTGGSSHFWDVRELINGFTKVNQDVNILRSLPPAQFILAGYDDRNDSSKKEWTRIENSFNLNGKLHNYERRTTLPLESYMDHYKHADVCLIPLEDTHFNYFKSNLKIIEAGCKNIPVIASKVPPYSDEPNRKAIMYASNAREWHDHIKKCATDPSFAQDQGKRLGEYVREVYNMEKVNIYRKQLFENLIN